MSEKGERVTEHKNLRKGDLVRIQGEIGATFEVLWIDHFNVNRPEEVTVIGGKGGRKLVRTFLFDRVIKKPKKQQRKREDNR